VKASSILCGQAEDQVLRQMTVELEEIGLLFGDVGVRNIWRQSLVCSRFGRAENVDRARRAQARNAP